MAIIVATAMLLGLVASAVGLASGNNGQSEPVPDPRGEPLLVPDGG